jgi:hypothetical protein
MLGGLSLKVSRRNRNNDREVEINLERDKTAW